MALDGPPSHHLILLAGDIYEVALLHFPPNLAEVADSNRKEHVNMVFIGHVDAGKSTIGGQLMYLAGMVDKRTLEKYEREAKDKGRESWSVVFVFVSVVESC